MKLKIGNQYVFHPGETVDEMLQDRNITTAELAEASDIPEEAIQKLIDGKADVTDEIAEALERGFGVDNSKSFWLNLQHTYDKKITAFWKDSIVKGGLVFIAGFIMMLGYSSVEKWAMNASVIIEPQAVMASYLLLEIIFGLFGGSLLIYGLAYFLERKVRKEEG